MSQLQSNELKNGTVFDVDGKTYVVIKYEHNKHGRGGATVRVKVKDLTSGAVVEKTFRGNESVEESDISRSSAQYLYSDTNNSYFLDSDTFEQIVIHVDENVKNYLKEGEKAILLYKDGEALLAELPNTVVLEVTYTEPGFKGNTTSNALKSATVETGKEIRVPMFINTGDKIKINTESGDYLSRA